MHKRFFIAANIIFACLYLLSFFGSTTVVKINVDQGDHYKLTVNNKLLGEVKVKPFSPSVVSTTFTSPGLPPFLPFKQETTNIIFISDDGEVISQKNNLTLKHTSNYSIVSTIKNLYSSNIIFYNPIENDKLTLFLRSFREQDYYWIQDVNNQRIDHGGGVIRDYGYGTLFLILGTFLSCYPYLIILLLFMWFLKRISIIFSKITLLRIKVHFPWILLIMGLCFLNILNLSLNYLGGIPHVPDSVIYYMQAKFLNGFSFFGHPSISSELFKFFDVFPNYMTFANGKWFGQYLFGYPLVLSLGTYLNAAWIIPPLISVLFIYSLYLLGREILPPKYILIPPVVAIISPFFQMNAASFMSHGTASFYLVLTLLFLIKGVKKNNLFFLLLSGLFWGLIFNTRTLSAFGILLPCFLFIVFYKKTSLPDTIKRLGFFLFGCELLILFYFLQNYILMGNPITPPYLMSNTYSTTNLGFFGGYTISKSLLHMWTNLTLFTNVLFGWPGFLTLIFPIAGLVLVGKNRYIYFLWFCFFSMAGAWMLYNGTYIMYGPRMWYEMAPIAFVLFALGIEAISDNFPQKGLGFFVSISFCTLLFIRTIWGFNFGKIDLWPGITFTPQKIDELRGFNFVDDRLIKESKKQSIGNALIFVGVDSCGGWWCYGSVFWANNPQLNGDIVWAKDLGDSENVKLIEEYRGRKYFRADYSLGTIIPY